MEAGVKERNVTKLTEHVKNNDWKIVLEILKDMSSKLMHDGERDEIVTADIQALAFVFQYVLPITKNGSKEVMETVEECFRTLRNCCAGSPTNQNLIVQDMSILKYTKEILEILSTSSSSENVVAGLRLGAQFIGNLIVSNRSNQDIIWKDYCHLLRNLLIYEDSKVTNYAAMIIYNILLGKPDLSSEVSIEVLDALICLSMDGSEFASYSLEVLLSQEGYVESMYHQIEAKHQLFLLDELYVMISSNVDSHVEKNKVPVSTVTFLAKEFKNRSDSILKTCEKPVETLEPVEVSKFLEVLASASSSKCYLDPLQEDGSLLVDAVYLLKSIHSLGKTGDNSFSVIQKLSDLSIKGGNKEVQEHPAFGFKGNLIRLIGNLSFQHEANQDQVRELDAIPVLLDCCNIDARNPFIIQWVILAVRNLCEKNLKNQAVIATMTREGVVDSAVLHELGLTLESSGEKITIAPFNR